MAPKKKPISKLKHAASQHGKRRSGRQINPPVEHICKFDDCDQSFATIYGLYEHYKGAHPEDYPMFKHVRKEANFKCPHCDFLSVAKTALKMHVYRKHRVPD